MWAKSRTEMVRFCLLAGRGGGMVEYRYALLVLHKHNTHTHKDSDHTDQEAVKKRSVILPQTFSRTRSHPRPYVQPIWFSFDVFGIWPGKGIFCESATAEWNKKKANKGESEVVFQFFSNERHMDHRTTDSLQSMVAFDGEIASRHTLESTGMHRPKPNSSGGGSVTVHTIDWQHT